MLNALTARQPLAHALFRMIFGFAFMTHGAQKLFGWFGGNAVGFGLSEFTAAGLIEMTCGILIMIGFKTNWAAFLASGEMAVAYFWKHSMRAEGFQVFHWQNRGELVMLFCFAFLLLATMGSGPFSVDAAMAKKAGSKS
jgi:putative oxidoreductase